MDEEETFPARPEESYAAVLRVHAHRIRQIAHELDIQAQHAEQTPGGLFRLDPAASRSYDVFDRLAEIPPEATRPITALVQSEQLPEQPTRITDARRTA